MSALISGRRAQWGACVLALALSGLISVPAAIGAASGPTTGRVSVAGDGTQGNFPSGAGAISADGRFVAFESEATNLVPSDTNRLTAGGSDVFVRDRRTGVTTRVSVDSAGAQGAPTGHGAFDPAISDDGRYVAFQSNFTNLVPDDTNGQPDVFVHDRLTGATERVSVSSLGDQANANSYNPSISADGRYVAFESPAAELVVCRPVDPLSTVCAPGSSDTNSAEDIFVHDRQTATTTRVSVASDGTQAGGNDFPARSCSSCASRSPSISADGRHVAFYSRAPDLVPADTNGVVDVFVHDRQTGATTRVSLAGDGSQGDDESWYPEISPDGRYVAYSSAASNLVPGDTNTALDVFVHDRQTGATTRVNLASDGQQATGASTSASGFESTESGAGPLSADGRYVTFESYATNLVAGDTNGRPDVFLHDRQTGVTSRVSESSDGAQGNSDSTIPVDISAEGRYVTFTSSATNL
ncbi:MAG: hypothetical protein ABIS21_03295, partial [Acidimicrobiales bacterium]